MSYHNREIDDLELYKIVASHPLTTKFHQRAYGFTYQLEQAGFFSSEKARYIRESQLSMAIDPITGLSVDLLGTKPRKIVKNSNRLITETIAKYSSSIRGGGVRQTYTDALPEEILFRPRMSPVRDSFPEIGNLGKNVVYVYGNPGDWSYSFTVDGVTTVAVAPDLFGLPTQLIETVTKVWYLGSYNERIGLPLINACYEIIAEEKHATLIGVVWMMERLLKKQGIEANLRELARQFILGDPDPLFETLALANPLAPALLTYVRGFSSAPTLAIARIKAINELDK